MTPDERGKREETGRWFRPWIPVLLLSLIAILSLAAYVTLAYYEPRVLAAATTSLREASGRDVQIEGFQFALPIRIERIVIGGDGVIDTRPLLVMTGVTVWPDVRSLLRFQPRIGLLQAESAVLRLREVDGNWSSRGAFAKPPSDEPAISTLALPNLLVLVEARGRSVDRLLRVNLDMTSHGAFTLFFHGEEAHGRINYSGVGPSASYRLDVALDHLPEQLSKAERITIVGNYHVDSQLVDFSVVGNFLGKNAQLSGRVRFDTSHVQTETGAWTWGNQNGRVLVSYDNDDDRRIDVLTVGRITIPLPLGSMAAEPLTGGTIHVDKMNLSGPLNGPWQINAHVVGEDMQASGAMELTDGELDGDVTVDVSSSHAVRLVRSRAKIRFARARAAGYEAQNADLDLEATPRQVVVSGHASTLGGSVTVRDFLITLGAGSQPESVRGHLALDHLDGRDLAGVMNQVVLRHITGSYDVDATKERGGWRLQRADGFTERIEGSYRGEPFTISQAHIIARGQPGDAGSIFSFNGYVSIFEGRGRLRADIEGSDIVDAWMEVHDVDLGAANRVFHSPRLEAISRHVDRVSMAGRLRFATDEDGETGLIFDGSINSNGLGIEVSSDAAFSEERDATLPATPTVPAATPDSPPPASSVTAPESASVPAAGRNVNASVEVGVPIVMAAWAPHWTSEENAAGGGGDEERGRAARPARAGRHRAKGFSATSAEDAGLSTALDLVSIFRLDGLPMQVRARGRMRLGGEHDPVRMSGLELAIDTDRTVLSVDSAVWYENRLTAHLRIHRIDAEHLRIAARHLAPNPLTESLPLRGALSGDVHLERDSGSFYASIGIQGDLALRDSPLMFNAVGTVTNIGPDLRIAIDTIGIDALHQSLADLNSQMDRRTMSWTGTAGVTLTMTEAWDTMIVVGNASFRDAGVRFPADTIAALGINGNLTFRVRKGRLLASELLPNAAPLTCARLSYNDVVVDRIHALARFNEKSLLLESMTFSLAGGRGTGGFTIDFPSWDRPRTGIFGRIKDCNLETVYRQMQPFAGNLTGTASADVSLLMDQEQVQKLELRGTARNGVISTSLLTPVIDRMDSGMVRNSLESLADWRYDSASFHARYVPNTYSPFEAEGLFLDARKTAEIPLSLAIVGLVYPFIRAQILHLPTPFARIGIPLQLQTPNLPLRLTMYRVGRKIGR